MKLDPEGKKRLKSMKKTLAAGLPLAGLLAACLLAEACGESFRPGMAGKFVRDYRMETDEFLEIGADGQVTWKPDKRDTLWRGWLTGPDPGGYYSLSLDTEEGTKTVALAYDPVAPAWSVAKGWETRGKRQLFRKEGELTARLQAYFDWRFVLDEPFKADNVADAEARLVGIWANFAEGFGLHALFLSENHLGVVLADVGGAGLKWRALKDDGKWFVVAETMETPGMGKKVVLLMAADLRRERLERLGAADSEEEVWAKYRDGIEDREWWEFYRVVNAVPEEWERRIAAFPAAAERERVSAAARERARQVELERRERERPRQEEVLRMLRENPAVLLELEFPLYGKDERFGLADLPRDSPELRATNEALADSSIPFTEAILMAFLEKQPTVDYWRFFHPIFARDELGPDARRRIAPRIADTGNYDDACVFFNHPNTPLDVLLEAEKDTGMAGGAVDCLKNRLKREGIR